MQRRHFAAWLGLGALPTRSPLARATPAPDWPAPSHVALAWRGPSETDTHHAGRVRVDWAAGTVHLMQAVPLPGRPHGLQVEDDGSLLVVAVRPGRWLWRIGADGRVRERLSTADEPDDPRLDGHVISSADGRWLYTTQTDPRTGQGWVAVRDRSTLATVDRWPTHGIDPHQLLLDGPGALMVANGGIPRDAQGRKHSLERMAPSLVRLDTRDGRLQGQWRLPDARLSVRHMAWSTAQAGQPRHLGLALQAEHDDPARRTDAPLLALWDGASLHAAPVPPGGAGYAGDIVATPDGGFLLSAQRAGRVLRWSPSDGDATWSLAGQLADACALGPASSHDDARVLMGARGLGRWHPAQAAAMLPWPQSMAVDNHCVLWENAAA